MPRDTEDRANGRPRTVAADGGSRTETVGGGTQKVTTDGTTLRYADAGDPDRPTVAFLPDAGFGPWSWGWQAPALAGPYRTLVSATRGTDGSNASAPYGVDRLAADLEAVLADASVDHVHLVGAGLGGMVALRYAREYGRARSLVLVGAAPSGDDVDDEALVRLHPSPDDRSVLRGSLSLAFSERFLTDAAVGRDVAESVVEWRDDEDAGGDALAGHLDAVLRFDAGALHEVQLPTLVCHGVDDPVVPVGAGQTLADALPRGRFEPVEGKRLCYVEHSAAVTDAIDGFVDGVRSR